LGCISLKARSYSITFEKTRRSLYFIDAHPTQGWTPFAKPAITAVMTFANPPLDCPLCPRLVEFRKANQLAHPDFFNAPVPAFGSLDARLLVVGLAPGLKGANATGRPFTGDYAGDVLYDILKNQGFAKGIYAQHRNDGLELVDCRITNAVRCVPPQNKPETAEIHICNSFLQQEMAAMPNLQVVFSLGSISHQAVLRACGLKISHAKFGHGAAHPIQPSFRNAPLWLVDTYHSSRYNINTNRVTPQMIEEVLAEIRNNYLS
jgi:uracil-DNA glycosylase family 4